MGACKIPGSWRLLVMVMKEKYYVKRMDTPVRRSCVGGTQPLPPRGRHQTRQQNPLAGLGVTTPQ
jgi:hypothetical protein